MSTPYPPPVDQLLALGRPEIGVREPWPDYLAMGFTGEHVPELVRMATDLELVEGDAEAAETYGGIHAWRTLGQLRAEAAIEPLIGHLGETDDDWALDEIPWVLGMIGPAALEPLRAALARWSLQRDWWVGCAAAGGLVVIATHFADMRDAVVAALTKQLRWWARHDLELNTILVVDLVLLDAVEAAPVIEEAFAAGAVDTRVIPDWEDAQVALGLLPERITPRPEYEPAWLHSTPFRIVRPARASRPKRRPKARQKARPRNHKRR